MRLKISRISITAFGSTILKLEVTWRIWLIE
ncbi:hypothetical protein J729_4728, partial [Acinetobacter baumannii 929679-598]